MPAIALRSIATVLTDELTGERKIQHAKPTYGLCLARHAAGRTSERQITMSPYAPSYEPPPEPPWTFAGLAAIWIFIIAVGTALIVPLMPDDENRKKP